MLSNLTIAKKLAAGFGLIILIICVLVVVARNGFAEIDETVKWNIHTYKVIDDTGELLLSLTNIETGMRGFALSGQDDFLEPLTAGKASFDKAWRDLKSLTADNAAQQKRLDQLQSIQRRWMSEQIEGTLALRRAVVAGQSTLDALVQRIVARQDKVEMDAMRALVAEIRGDEEKLLAERSEALTDTKGFAVISLMLCGVLAAIAAFIIAWSLSASIKRRLTDAIEIARAIASGRLDSRIDASGSDEIGSLLAAFDAMQQRLREMIGEIKQGAQQLLQAAGEISGSSNALSGAGREQSQAASSMAATVEQLTVSIGHVANNASEAHGISTDSDRQSRDGGEVIQRTLKSMGQIASTVQNSAEQIAELGRHIEQITSIVNVISAIAEQTNLLALNAAIEAARAGDQGRGFAVVADEVRLLAQRTGKSTQEIGDMINKIQSSTQDAVGKMGVGVEQVNQGLELAHSANEAIEQIRGGSGRIISVVEQISHALQEQTAASQDVARSVERIAQMAQANSQSIDGASRNAARVEQLAQALDRQVDQFRV